MRRALSMIALTILGLNLCCAPQGEYEEVYAVPFRLIGTQLPMSPGLSVGVHVARDQEELDGLLEDGSGLANPIDFSKEIVVYRLVERCGTWCGGQRLFHYLVWAGGDTVVIELPWVEEPRPCTDLCLSVGPSRHALFALPVEYTDYRFEAR